MEITINGNNIRIMGRNGGGKRGINIYCNELVDHDYISISTIDNGMERGNFPSLSIYKDNIIMCKDGKKIVVE